VPCGCQARIRCGFPVKKSISVRIRYKSGGLAVGSSGCGAVRVRCQANKPSKQAKVRCLVPVRVYPSKDKMVWFGAVLSAMVGCKVKVLG
jgi:hypothetical protein